MDNLESHTYEVFEKDPVKYSEYQRVSSLFLSFFSALPLFPVSLPLSFSSSPPPISPQPFFLSLPLLFLQF